MPFDEANLTSKELLGFRWEKEADAMFDQNRMCHYSNPKEPYEWKRHIGSGVDTVLSIFGYLVAVECKYSNCKVYPAHIRSDYLPRFKGKYDFKIVLSNDKAKYCWSAQRLLFEHGIHLFNKVDLLNWYYRMLYERFKGGISKCQGSYSSYHVKCLISNGKRYNNRVIDRLATKNTGLGDENGYLWSDSPKGAQKQKINKCL